MSAKIKVAGVSYLNTKPLLYGIEKSNLRNDIDLILNHPAKIAEGLQSGLYDIALLPVAVIPSLPGARIVSEYGIAANGPVASVCIFSQVPIEDVREVYLDYQSRTSIKLAQALMKYHWNREVIWKSAPENYIEYINGATAGVIIGDRALKQLNNFEYIYDLSEHWKFYTGLPFIFAAWVACRELPEDFLNQFNEANRAGLQYIKEVVTDNPFPYYDLHTYYTQNIQYLLDTEAHKGLRRFMELL